MLFQEGNDLRRGNKITLWKQIETKNDAFSLQLSTVFDLFIVRNRVHFERNSILKQEKLSKILDFEGKGPKRRSMIENGTKGTKRTVVFQDEVATVWFGLAFEGDLDEVAVGEEDRLLAAVAAADVNDAARVRLADAAVTLALERGGAVQVDAELLLPIGDGEVHQGDVDPLARQQLQAVGRVIQTTPCLLADVAR